MNALMNGFLGVLEDQATLYQSLLSVLKEEKEAIIKTNVEKLNELLLMLPPLSLRYILSNAGSGRFHLTNQPEMLLFRKGFE